MTTASITPVDIRLRDAVARQLAWDHEVDAAAIGVASGWFWVEMPKPRR